MGNEIQSPGTHSYHPSKGLLIDKSGVSRLLCITTPWVDLHSERVERGHQRNRSVPYWGGLVVPLWTNRAHKNQTMGPGCSSMVEHLFSMYEVPESISSNTLYK